MFPKMLPLIRLDLYRSRWFIATFVVLLLINAANVYVTRGGQAGDANIAVYASIPSLYGNIIAALMLLGSIIQNDSPTEPNAFWRSAPVSPATLLAGKFIVIALTVFLPLAVAQVIALSALPVARSDTTASFLPAIGGMILLLLSPATAAAVTPTFRSYILAAIGFFFLTTLIGTIPAIDSLNTQLRASNQLTSVSIASTLIIVCWLTSLYWTRRSVAKSRAISVSVVLFAYYLPLSAFAIAQTFGTRLQVVQATSPTDYRASASGSGIVIEFSVEAPDQFHRLAMVNPVATLIRNGATPVVLTPGFNLRSFHGDNYHGVLINRRETVLEPASGVLKADSTAPKSVLRVALNFSLPDAELLRTLREGGGTIMFSGFLETESLDTIVSLRADTDQVVFRDGWYYQTSLVARGDSGSQFQIRGWSLSPTNRAYSNIFTSGGASADFFRLRSQGYTIWPYVASPKQQLISRVSGDSVELTSPRGESTGLPLPLPTTAFYNAVQIYQIVDSPTASISIDDVRNSQFVITRWVYAHHRLIHATMRVF